METFSALLALCAGNSPVPGQFPAQRPMVWSFDVSLMCTRINGWVNNGEAGDLKRHRAHYDSIVMKEMIRFYCHTTPPPPPHPHPFPSSKADTDIRTKINKNVSYYMNSMFLTYWPWTNITGHLERTHATTRDKQCKYYKYVVRFIMTVVTLFLTALAADDLEKSINDNLL